MPHQLRLVRFVFFDHLDRTLLLVHAAAAWSLAGLIWTVQIAHYPSFEHVGAERFRAFHASYTTRIGFVVGPLMLVELACALWLVAQLPAGVDVSLTWSGLALVLVAWTSTAFLQMPAHRVLATGFDANAHRRLVATNWIRTCAWSARAVLALVLLR